MSFPFRLAAIGDILLLQYQSSLVPISSYPGFPHPDLSLAAVEKRQTMEKIFSTGEENLGIKLCTQSSKIQL